MFGIQLELCRCFLDLKKGRTSLLQHTSAPLTFPCSTPGQRRALHSHTVNSHKVTFEIDSPRGGAHVRCSGFWVFFFQGWLFMKTKGTCTDTKTSWKCHMPKSQRQSVFCSCHPPAVQPKCCQALMCSTFKAMRLFRCFYLRDHLLHIHDGLAHAPQATLLFRSACRKTWGRQQRLFILARFK